MGRLRVLGMMSGTSLDGIDASLVEFVDDAPVLHARVLGSLGMPFPGELRDELLAALPPSRMPVETWCRLDALVGQAYAELVRRAQRELGPFDLVSMHGQTVFHWVEDGSTRASLQIGNPSWVAATGVPVISDLRSADIAAGGHGAPLAPVLDELWLADEPTVTLNLGGIANITHIGPSGVVVGDTGPANCLLDAICQRDFALPYDKDGRIAAAGQVDVAALDALLAESFFALPLPRSTGRELFNPAWLDERLASLPSPPQGADLLATLTELTARSIADALGSLPPVQRLVASGGGVRNSHLMGRITELTGLGTVTSAALGIDPQAKEGVLFALLGWLSAHGHPAGGAGVVLGSLTPPGALGPLTCASITRLVVDLD